MTQPVSFRDEDELEDFLSTPQEETVDMMARLDGDIIVLGIGGKMGPTLGSMIVKAARRAGVKKNVYGVSRFSNSGLASKLERQGITCIPCDLLNPDDVSKLPKVRNVIYMAGRKFGIRGTDYLYWAMNTMAPAYTARHFADSNIVAFSTGNVYAMWPTDSSGSSETDPLLPLGEYSNSCIGRERIFEYFSLESGLRVLQFRLSYAIDLRYGVLFEIGRQVFEEKPVSLDTGYANVIWQGDANNIALRCLEHCASPPNILNVTGDRIRIRYAAQQFGEILSKEPRFTGTEAPTAFLSNTDKLKELFGPPPTKSGDMIRWIAGWIKSGGATLDKPTHFQIRDGQYLD